MSKGHVNAPPSAMVTMGRIASSRSAVAVSLVGMHMLVCESTTTYHALRIALCVTPCPLLSWSVDVVVPKRCDVARAGLDGLRC